MSAVGRRYAKAVFALAKDTGTLEAVAEHLAQIADVAAEPAVDAVLRNPLLSQARRTDIVASFVRQLGLPDLLARSLRVLADHQRLGELTSINAHYQRQLDDALGRVRATIRSAQSLTPQQETELIATFAKLVGKRVLATVAVDPDLLGGVVVEVAGKVYDGSVRSHLDRLARELAGPGSH